MNFPFFISRRYFLSKNNTNVINIISLISILGVSVGAFALIVVLSVFNGMEQIARNNFNSFDPELKIISSNESLFNINKTDSAISHCKSIKYKSFTLSQNALVKYKNKQQAFEILGVDKYFRKVTGVDSMIINGNFQLYDKKMPMAVIGYNVKYYLQVGIYLMYPLKMYVPKKEGKVSMMNPEKMFYKANIFASGVYGIDPSVDNNIIIPLDYMQEFTHSEGKANAVLLKLHTGVNIDKIQQNLSAMLGNEFKVLNRFQQHESIYKILKSEKVIVFIILIFILLIASVNIVGSVAMLILDKKKDMFILTSMGADKKSLKKIFLYQSWLISQTGIVLGLIAGSILIYLQSKYGFVKLNNSSNAFLINSYPVHFMWTDLIYIYLSVSAIGLLSGWLPVSYVFKKQSITEE